MWGSKGIATIWTWRVVGAELKDFCETVSSKHGGEKAPVLIRPLVQKLPIDFHRGWSWADDQPEFSASTKAKLSHLEAGSAYRDQHSPLTLAANLFPSGGAFFFFLGGKQLQNFNTMVPLLMVLACNFLLHQSLLSLGLKPFASVWTTVAKRQQAPVFICYFLYKLTGQTSQKLHKPIKPALKKQLALHQVITKRTFFVVLFLFLPWNHFLKSEFVWIEVFKIW